MRKSSSSRYWSRFRFDQLARRTRKPQDRATAFGFEPLEDRRLLAANTINLFTVAPTVVGDDFQLAARLDPSEVGKTIQFYWDQNHNGVWDTGDASLGSQTAFNAGGDSQATKTNLESQKPPGFGTGLQRFFAFVSAANPNPALIANKAQTFFGGTDTAPSII